MHTLFVLIRRIIYITLGMVDHLMGKTSSVVVLCYHSISDDGWRFSVSKKAFRRQMQTIQKTHTAISLSQLGGYIQGKEHLPKHSFVVTFDDGYKNIQSVIPVCKELGIIPTVFVVSDPSHVNRKTLQNELPLLTTNEIGTLMTAGWEIGSHTATHAVLKSKANATLEKEVGDSKQEIEKQIKQSVHYIAYPKGDYSDRVVRMVKKSGYALGMSMDDGVITRHTNRFTIPRIGVDHTHSTVEFSSIYSPSVIAFRTLIKASPFGRFF